MPTRDRLDSRVRAHGQPESLRELPDARLGRMLVQERAPGRLGGEDDVLRHGHHRDEHEVLVHHPDAGVDRLAGDEMRSGFPFSLNSPSSGW